MYSFELEDNERILKKDLATLQMDNNAYTGAFYLTSARLVFVGTYLGVNVRRFIEDVPLEHVAEIKPEKTFFVIPNVLAISTIRGRNYKVLVKQRDSWLAEIMAQMDRL